MVVIGLRVPKPGGIFNSLASDCSSLQICSWIERSSSTVNNTADDVDQESRYSSSTTLVASEFQSVLAGRRWSGSGHKKDLGVLKNSQEFVKRRQAIERYGPILNFSRSLSSSRHWFFLSPNRRFFCKKRDINCVLWIDRALRVSISIAFFGGLLNLGAVRARQECRRRSRRRRRPLSLAWESLFKSCLQSLECHSIFCPRSTPRPFVSN